MTYEQFKNQRRMVLYDVCRYYFMPHAKGDVREFLDRVAESGGRTRQLLLDRMAFGWDL